MTTPNNIQRVTKIGGRRIVRVAREPTIEEKNRYANNIIKKTFHKGIRPIGKTTFISFKQNEEILSFDNPNVRAVIDQKGNHICYIVEGEHNKMSVNEAMKLEEEMNEIEEDNKVLDDLANEFE